jgi:hypothetical protein
MPQLSYSIVHGNGYEGSRADSGPLEADAALNTSVAEIPFGRVVVLDTSGVSTLGPNDYVPAKLIAGAPAAGTILGISLYDPARETGGAIGSVPAIVAGDMFSVCKHGDVYMVPEQDVTPADPVFVRHTANGSPGTYDAIGRVRKDADTANAIAVPGWRFKGKGLAGTLVAVEIIRLQ